MSHRACLLLLLSLLIATARALPSPPQKPEYDYVSSLYTVEETGSCVDGSRVWVYSPETLKPGGPDVVIYLHGFSVNKPGSYSGHIEHIVKQGNYVLYPQFQEGACEIGNGFINGWLQRLGLKQSPARWIVTAAESTADVLASLPAYNNVYLFGHSLGGAFALMWGSLGDRFPQPVTAAVLSSPQPAGYSAIPGFVTTLFFFVFGEDIDVPEAAPETTFPIAVLHAEDDTIAPLDDVLPSYEALGSVQKAIYQAQSDSYGDGNLIAGHSVAISMASGSQQDNLDWRYVWSGLDQVMNGVEVDNLLFDMGLWSDGRPVNEVLLLTGDADL